MTPSNLFGKFSPYPIVQLGWSVPDLKEAIDLWVKTTGAGPWFTMEHIPLFNVKHRGKPSSFDHSNAIAWWGGVEVELMQQHCNTPSHIRDIFPDAGYGFASVSWIVPDVDAEARRLEALGFPLCWECTIIEGSELRALWFNSRHVLGGMIEVFADFPMLRKSFLQVEKACRNWNGERPVRPAAEWMAIEVD